MTSDLAQRKAYQIAPTAPAYLRKRIAIAIDSCWKKGWEEGVDSVLEAAYETPDFNESIFTHSDIGAITRHLISTVLQPNVNRIEKKAWEKALEEAAKVAESVDSSDEGTCSYRYGEEGQRIANAIRRLKEIQK